MFDPSQGWVSNGQMSATGFTPGNALAGMAGGGGPRGQSFSDWRQQRLGVPAMTPVPPGAQSFGGQQGMPGNMQNALSGFQDWRTAMNDWRGDRPQFAQPPAGGWGDPAARQAAMGDWRGQIQDWRQARPTFGSFFQGA
jgi:hypothetical protein